MNDLPQPNNKIIRITIAAISTVFVVVIFFWLFYNPAENIIENVPGMDKSGADTIAIQKVNIGEKFERFAENETGLKGTWPRFRGAGFDNIIKTDIPINDEWKANPLKIVWSVALGEGHAAPAIYEGQVYLLDYDEKEKADILRCFSLTGGIEIWRRGYNVRLKRNHGMSRTIPAVTEKYILTIGPKCHVMCMERTTGNLLWALNLEKDYNTETPFWYTGQCPLIDNNVAVIATGGKVLMIGVDCQTGKILWETLNTGKWKMSHSSIIPMIFGGKNMYVYCAVGGMAGIASDGDDIGKLLWSYSAWSPNVVAPSPVFIGDDKLLMTAGYGAGSVVLKIEKQGNNFAAKEVHRYTPGQGIASEQQTPVFYKDKIYCILPKDAGSLRNLFVSYNPGDCGKAVCTGEKTDRFGLGPFLFINDYCFILNDDGNLSLFKISNMENRKIAEQKLFDGQDAWGPLAFADGFLLLRDLKKMYCVDLRTAHTIE